MSDLNSIEQQSVTRIVLSDCILLTISWIFAFRMVAVFVFLNEFPYVVEHNYNYDEFISGTALQVVITSFHVCEQ